jgi:hypothetical protein
MRAVMIEGPSRGRWNWSKSRDFGRGVEFYLHRVRTCHPLARGRRLVLLSRFFWWPHSGWQARAWSETGNPPPGGCFGCRTSEHELEEINAMPPQDQVMRLVERTINHYAGAGEEIEKRSEGWMGQVLRRPSSPS